MCVCVWEDDSAGVLRSVNSNTLHSVFPSRVNFLEVVSAQRFAFSYLAQQSVIGVWEQKLQLFWEPQELGLVSDSNVPSKRIKSVERQRKEM